MKKIIFNLVVIIISFITILGLNIDLSREIRFVDSFSGNNYIYIVLFIFYVYFIKDSLKNSKGKRLVIISSFFSLLLTLFEIIGHSIYTYTDMSGLISSTSVFMKNILKSISIYTTIYCSIIFIYQKILPKINNSVTEKDEVKKYKFFLYWGIIFACYLPYFLTYYPGILSWDSLVQMQQGIGMQELTAHHPLLHTLIITICIKIGMFICGSYSFGAAIYSIVQLLFMSGIFAYAIYYMKKNNINKYIVYISLAYFALYPVMPLYGLTMWKDIPFALCMLLYIICLLELVYNKEKFLKSKSKNVLFTICILLVLFFRNNGIYVIFISFPIVLLFNKEAWKKLTLIFVIPIIIYKIINGPVIDALGIQKGSIREALSVPLQQLARVEINKKESLTNEEYELIHKFIKCNNIGQYYKTWLSDPIKDKLDEEYFYEHKLEFIKLWLKLFIKYPNQYFEAFFDNSVGYWYPEIDYMIVTRNIWHFEDGIIIEPNPIIKGKVIRFIDSFIDRRDIPIITLLFSIGFNIWVMFILMGYVIYKEKYKLLIVYVSLIALWLTVLASPLYAEYRYIFSLFTCLPILLGFTLKNSSKEVV